MCLSQRVRAGEFSFEIFSFSHGHIDTLLPRSNPQHLNKAAQFLCCQLASYQFTHSLPKFDHVDYATLKLLGF